MQGTSKVIMGATLVMVVSLAIVLGLILVLLAELYCSLLLRRRRLQRQPHIAAVTSVSATTRPTSGTSHLSHPIDRQPIVSLRSLYAQGVICAPRGCLFPTLPNLKDDAEAASNNQQSQSHQVVDIESQKPEAILNQIELTAIDDRACGIGGRDDGDDGLVYISNPIFNNDSPGLLDTPFETPDSSPSRLQIGGSSSGEDETAKGSPSSPQSLPNTPPLTPMKKLPAEACSVPLSDARCLETSNSDSNVLSSSSSGSPCTSPSW